MFWKQLEILGLNILKVENYCLLENKSFQNQIEFWSYFYS